MANFEAPSFSLGLDLDLDFDLEPRHRSGGTQTRSLHDHAPGNITVESELHVSDSDPEVSVPALKRLRRGPGRAYRGQLAEASPRCDVDEEIEEFSSQEDLRRDEHPSTQYHSVCSSSKAPLRAPGVLTSQTASHRKTEKREQPSNHPASSSLEASSSKLMFPKLTVSPLRRFQLLDSDSDDPSVSEDANQEAGKSHPSAKVGQSSHRQYSSASEEKSTKTSVSMPQNVDLWKDFCPNTSVSIPTPVLDEVCDEYFRSVKDKNVTLKLGIGGCLSNRSNLNKNSTKTVQHQLDLADPLPPAHRYFFHHDPRIQELVCSRLPHFSPLGVVSNTNMQHGASVINYMCQFSHEEASKKQVNQDVGIERTTTKARKNARKLNAEEALNASGSWVNPKNSAGIPKKSGKKQVHVNGQSAGKWYTSPEGRKVYVTKGGQELTGSIAYRHYKKDSGVKFKKSKRKSTAKRTSKKKQKT